MLHYLQSHEECKLHKILENAECLLFPIGSLLHHEDDNSAIKIIYLIPKNIYSELTLELESKLNKLSMDIFPNTPDQELVDMDTMPATTTSTVDIDFSNIDSRLQIVIPSSLRSSSKMMGESYVFMYCVENIMRKFVEYVLKNKTNYLDNVEFKKINENITWRKEKEGNNKSISTTRDDIYYTTFGELKQIIDFYWNDNFKCYFNPHFKREWFGERLDWLEACRNVVYHNNKIESEAQEQCKMYFGQILEQLPLNKMIE